MQGSARGRSPLTGTNINRGFANNGEGAESFSRTTKVCHTKKDEFLDVKTLLPGIFHTISVPAYNFWMWVEDETANARTGQRTTYRYGADNIELRA